MSNYGWVPRVEGDDYLERLALLVSRRANMELIEPAGTIDDVDTLLEFIAEANRRAAPPPPINEELVVGGHASTLDGLLVDPFPGSPGPWTDYEALEASMNGASQPIAIPDQLIGYSTTSPNPTARAFHIKGCNVGKATPWLTKLHSALGGHVRVTAPRHFHGVSTNGTMGTSSVDILEWMAHEFVVFQKTAIPSRNALAAAFHAKGYARPDGTPIPLASFRAWLKFLAITPRMQAHDTFIQSKNIRVPLGRNIGGLKYTSGVMHYDCTTPDDPTIEETFTFPAGEAPTDNPAGLLAALPSLLLTRREYQATHPFPIYQRVGYTTISDMIANLKWTFKVTNHTTPTSVTCFGGRFQYELLVPIANPGPRGAVEPTKAPLIYNHIPETGPPAVAPAFDENNTFYFGTVP